MSVLRSIVRSVIFEAVGTEQPTPDDIALAYYAMSISPVRVVEKIRANNSPILSYIRVVTDSAGNPVRVGSLNKIEMQMGVPLPSPSVLSKVRSQLGSMSDLREKVRKAADPRGRRPTEIVRKIAEADIDERFFPKELVFELISSMKSLGVVKNVADISILPKETRGTIKGMKATLSIIEDSYKSKKVHSAVEEVREKIDEFVLAFRQRKSSQVGRNPVSDFQFTDVEEQEHDLDALDSGVDLDTVYDRRALRSMSLSEALLGPSPSDDDKGDEDDPYAFDIGDPATFDSPVDTVAGSPEKAGEEQAELPDGDEDDEEREGPAQSLLGYLAELNDLERSGAHHTEEAKGDLEASVHELIDAMNEEDAQNPAAGVLV